MSEPAELAIAEDPTRAEKLLSSMAILQVNWEHERKSYLDNFLPFAAEAMSRSNHTSFTDDLVTELLRREFALELPPSVVHSLLRRAQRIGLGHRTNAGKFVLDPAGKGSASQVSSKQAEVHRQMRSLVVGYVDYSREFLKITVDEVEAGSDLIAFIDQYAAPILGAAHRGEALDIDASLSKRDRTALAAYFDYLSDCKPAEFEYLVSIAQGAMLASSLFREEPTTVEDRFEGTDLYIDTPVAFRALGFFGEPAQSAQLATLAGAIQLGAGVKCFEDTVGEMRRVVEAVANHLRNSAFSPDENSIGLYFLRKGLTPEEVRATAATVERDLRRIGVEIVSTPGPVERFEVDQDALASLLQETRANYGRRALEHDVEALASMSRLRRGRASDRLEKSRATFVTTNPRLIAGASDYAGFAREKFPLAMFEDRVATLIWIKTPLGYPDLPRDQLLSRVLSLLSPSRATWAKYIEQIDRLRGRGQLDASDEILLRQHFESGRALVEETLNDPELVTEESVTVVLERVKSEIKKPLENAASDLRVEHAIKEQVLSAEVQIARQESVTLELKLREKVRKIASAVSSSIHIGLVIVVGSLLGLSFFFDWGWLTRTVEALVLIGLTFGSLTTPIKVARLRFKRAVERQLTRFFELPTAAGPRGQNRSSDS